MKKYPEQKLQTFEPVSQATGDELYQLFSKHLTYIGQKIQVIGGGTGIVGPGDAKLITFSYFERTASNIITMRGAYVDTSSGATGGVTTIDCVEGDANPPIFVANGLSNLSISWFI